MSSRETGREKALLEDFWAADERWVKLDAQIRKLQDKKASEAQNRDYLYRAILAERLKLR